MDKFKGYYLVKYDGLNFEKFTDFLIKNNVKIFDVKKQTQKEIYFKVSSRDYKTVILKQDNKWYELSVIKKFGLAHLKEIFFKRIGLFVGLTCVIIFSVIFSKTTFNYSITGCENIKQEEVLQALKNYGVKFGKINHFDNDDLEHYLLENIPKISLVSVMTKGNTICVNIKEKTQSDVNVFEPITSPYTMLVGKVNLVSGTLLVKEGDVVLKGKQLVAPYVLNADGSKTPCKALATISGEVWFCGNVDFKTKESVLKRTGKKIKNSFLCFNEKVILSSVKENSFEFYEAEHEQTKLKNFFYPLTIKNEIIYECKYVDVSRDFEKEKDNLVAESKKMALATVPSGFEITEETQKTIKIGDLYKVQTYLKSNVEITNEG